MTRYHVVAFLLAVQALTAGCGGGSTVTPTPFTTYPATWITASWSGGRTTTPSDERTMQTPQNPLSPLCPPQALILNNYNYPELLSLRMLGDCPLYTTTCSNLVIANTCNTDVTVAICLASGSGGTIPAGAQLRNQCAQDPLQTPPDNLMRITLPASTTRNEISQVSPDLAISVFFCGGLDSVDGTPLKCHVL